MADLKLDPGLDDPDGFYDELLAAHHELSKAESDAFNARLILILSNHIGDREILRQALKAAGKNA
ncbi:DUF2783 domain-containing protein [uncultured Roseobacter sp.]|uniref:DUF2783 domain-containing protein n=1 Tax=uncultured Roseobacter sp. TaxID=114847 RepID=UPI00262237E4|nr:DUF2783 domain-containing protein [uncultured Roseobacter sp.]